MVQKQFLFPPTQKSQLMTTKVHLLGPCVCQKAFQALESNENQNTHEMKIMLIQHCISFIESLQYAWHSLNIICVFLVMVHSRLHIPPKRGFLQIHKMNTRKGPFCWLLENSLILAFSSIQRICYFAQQVSVN